MHNQSTNWYRILIVEDDPNIQDAYRRILCRHETGINSLPKTKESTAILSLDNMEIPLSNPEELHKFDIVICNQEKDALAALQQAQQDNYPFAAVFLGIQSLADKNKHWTAEQIRNNDPDIEIILVTEFSDVNPGEIARQIGPAHKILYLQKPFAAIALYQCAVTLTAKWNLERELQNLYAEIENKIRQRTANLEKTNQELLRIEKLKSDLAISISHELRTPLTIFRNILSNLKAGVQGPVNSRQKEALDTADQEIKRLARILNDFLDIGNLESGQIEMDIRIYPVQVITNYALRVLIPIFNQSNITLLLEIEKPDTVIMADLDRTIQILDKLIDNAIRYGNPEQPSVLLRVHEWNDRVVFDIEDNGKGIPADEVSRLFNRFVQIERQVGQGYHGTGLGLAISKKLIEMQKGNIWLERSPLGGARFCFTLPKVWKFTEDNSSSQIDNSARIRL